MYREGYEKEYVQRPLHKDYYAVLGISRTSSAPEIRSAFAKIAKNTHPDRHPGDKAAEEAFKTASEAYNVLSDVKKRAEYDRFEELHDLSNSVSFEESVYQRQTGGERRKTGKFRSKRDRDGIHLEDGFGRRVSDNFTDLVNHGNVYVARYSDGAFCVISAETGKTLTRGFRKIEVQENYAIGTLKDSGKKVLINPESGRESPEFWNIKIKAGKFFGKVGLFKYQEIRLPH